ncbi:RHS repeat-associated core domain-containing protein [Erwinia sp. J780]|uniref:Teneurin-like YD-shell domain-containing protein n=1 Tax=Erwinia sorbitola TaxID=2681984 RepID=A0A6I6EU92_9GAMM|nr:hypothetical protein GN242_13100 [Erwinia sorbitola]
MRFEYDNFGRLSALYNEKGEPFRFAYSALDGLMREVRPDGTVRELTRNRLGAVVKERLLGTQGGELCTTLVRDRAGRLVRREGADCRTEYEYRPGSLHIRHAGQAACRAALSAGQPPEYRTVSFDFDAAGQLAGERNHGGQYRYGYDAGGSLVSTAYPDGSRLLHCRYGSGHLLQSEFLHGGERHTLAEYARDRLHRETERTLGALTERTEYDAAGRITAKTAGRQAAGRPFSPVLARRWQYDRRHRMVKMTLTTGQEAGGYGVRQDTRWEYDGADRVLARYAEGREESFRWDASGNLLNGGAVAWNDQVSRAGDYRHEWDEFGRLARRISVKDSAVQHLHYDGDGRVTSVTFSGHPRYREVCYDYDGLGRRTAKTVKHVSPYEPDKRTDFYWQGMRLSAEQGTHEALTFHFYHGESHTPLARYDSGEGGMRYVHAEVNGMPQALSDREGNTVWRPLHTGLFGVIRREESRLSPYAARQNLRFAGQYYDEETGLHYNTLRYYDPGSGSFTQPDPIGLAGGINLYAYGPNPINWIDPLGLAGNPATATHITYQGIDAITGKPYVGYASMQGTQMAQDVLNYRYGGNFDRFGGQAPRVLYDGYGQSGKDVARGLEQRTFEQLGGLDGTANRQNPVGQGNARRTEYLGAADDHLNNKNGGGKKGGGC